MHPPPFEYVAFAIIPDDYDDDSPPEIVKRLGRAIGMTTDTDGYVWLYVEPPEHRALVVRVPLIHCRRAYPPEVTEYGNVSRRTLDVLTDSRRAEFATPTQDSQP